MSSQTEVTRNSGNGKVASRQQTKAARPESILRPPVDIYETDDGITLQADMPGVSKERLNLRIEGNTLLVEGTIGISPQDQMTALHADVRSTVYQRSFALSNGFEVDKIDADLKDGVLTVRLPKRAELRPRRIEITS
jgi:HSP20 family molecular chaperone IbpA